MSNKAAQDLTDTWHGRYTYPRFSPAVSFVAYLQQVGDGLVGTTEEPGPRKEMLSASLSGELSGNTVTFLKVYDTPTRRFREVRYTGVVRDEGLEIAGTWTVPGSWSGTFIMIRSRGLPLAMARKQMEKV